MNEELISEVSKILCDWNPLGENANSIDNLHEYKYEAMDILSTIKILKLTPEEAVSQVLSQAFHIKLNETDLKHYSLKIGQLLNVQ